MREHVTVETLARELDAIDLEVVSAHVRESGYLGEARRDWDSLPAPQQEVYRMRAARLLERYDLIRRATGGPLSELAITRILVRSSYVESIGYNNQHRMLEVAYRGPVCRYADVPPTVWTEVHEMVTKGLSVGRYLAEHIQPYYACTKLDPAVEEVLN